MTQSQATKYWQISAKHNLKTSEDLYITRHYDWCLFVGQLSLEKLIKGLVVKKTKQNPHPIHDLVKLCQQAKIKLTPPQARKLKEISRFNIEARYDDYKFRFYKQANKKFTSKWLTIIKQLFAWFKKLY